MSSEVVMSKEARMLRFVTPTEEWARRVRNSISVPAEWPLMLVEIFIGEHGVVQK